MRLAACIARAHVWWNRIGWGGGPPTFADRYAESVEVRGTLECVRCGTAMPIERWAQGR